MQAPDPTPVPDSLVAALAQLAAGDLRARSALLTSVADRFAVLARRQLRRFPAVARWEDTDDVVQGASQRLYRALEAVVPDSPRAFYGLCGEMIRRELLDLKRRHFGPQGIGANHASPRPDESHGTRHDNAQVIHDSTHDPAALARWTELHEAVEKLPDELRETFDLIWYQGMTQAEAAVVVGVAEKTIARRWRDARLRLHGLVEDGEV